MSQLMRINMPNDYAGTVVQCASDFHLTYFNKYSLIQVSNQYKNAICFIKRVKLDGLVLSPDKIASILRQIEQHKKQALTFSRKIKLGPYCDMSKILVLCRKLLHCDSLEQFSAKSNIEDDILAACSKSNCQLFTVLSIVFQHLQFILKYTIEMLYSSEQCKQQQPAEKIKPKYSLPALQRYKIRNQERVELSSLLNGSSCQKQTEEKHLGIQIRRLVYQNKVMEQQKEDNFPSLKNSNSPKQKPNIKSQRSALSPQADHPILIFVSPLRLKQKNCLTQLKIKNQIQIANKQLSFKNPQQSSRTQKISKTVVKKKFDNSQNPRNDTSIKVKQQREREREKQRDKQREREREKQRDKQREREREREKERERERERKKKSTVICLKQSSVQVQQESAAEPTLPQQGEQPDGPPRKIEFERILGELCAKNGGIRCQIRKYYNQMRRRNK